MFALDFLLRFPMHVGAVECVYSFTPLLIVSLIVPFLLPPVTGSPFLLVTVGLTHVSEFSFYLGTEVQ